MQTADVNARDSKKNTPLHKAAEGGFVECCELLLRHGADLRACNDEGHLSLHLAAKAGYTPCCELLLQYGSDPNAQVSISLRPMTGLDKCGSTPLHEAAAAAFVECCELLVSRGTDVTIKDDHGRMPLQRAHSDDVTQALLIGFYFEWDAALFRRLCEQGKAAVLRQYLDNFRIIPHPPRRPGRVKVYYHDLYRFYGEPWLPINDTPLYHVLNGAGEIATLVDHPVFEHVMNLKWAPTYQAKNVFVVLLIDLLVGLVFQIGLVQSMCLAPDRTGLSQFSAFGRHMYFIEAMWFLALLVSTYCSFISVDLTVARNMSMATATVMLMIEALDWNKRRWAYFKDVINWINLVAYGGVLALGILAAADLDLPHLDIARALFIVLLCFCGLDYLRMVPLTSLLISITFKMVNDVVRFVVLYGVFQIGFSGSFFLLFQHEGSRYNTYSEAFLATFLMLFGDFDADLFLRLDGAKAVVANVLVLCYLVGAMVMLMNLLIAMMSTSYQQVLDSAKVARRIARAEIILRMEGLLPHRARVYMFDHAVHDANLRHRLHALHDSDLKATGEPKPGANKMDAQETGGMNQLADKEESSSGGKKAETSKAPLLRRVDATHHTPGEGERAHRATTKTTEDRPAAHPANLAVERTFQVDGGAAPRRDANSTETKQKVNSSESELSE
ncbi:TPA: LOW QUALITY PROTEIN: hypothetical protein N0F65_010136 [Lagenidium giganteum]|uniref:Ion transport domain-containing protein n=1 Tax=Lagenidium giganteum TaxID=4803 RepID=A0AAV2Z608_9STRA|nr:TPA: LOW QUALITY PROTEIN: hypothetical protein N0F65_010136 [Lagenidium giganteum]